MVSVDTVYQRVLALANKEQRGYITPQEFNLYANQAQMEIFEQYFYDSSQFRRMQGNDNEYSDMVDIIEEKIHLFKTSAPVTNGASLDSLDDFYRLGDAYTSENTLPPLKRCHYIPWEDIILLLDSPLLNATHNRPVYTVKANQLKFYPPEKPDSNLDQDFYIDYIKKPKKVNWTYIVVAQKPLYNPSYTDHQDFELHVSEETKLVIKILQLAGIAIKDYNLVQVSAQKEVGRIQQEKQ